MTMKYMRKHENMLKAVPMEKGQKEPQLSAADIAKAYGRNEKFKNKQKDTNDGDKKKNDNESPSFQISIAFATIIAFMAV